MAGPYPQYSEPQPSYPHPSTLPPPVPYPTRRRWRLAVAIVAVAAVVAGAATAIVYALNAGSQTTATSTGQLTQSSAKTAIQDYLDALLNGDTDTVARNAGCGFYDALKEKRSDQALARLASQTFRKQFSKAEVSGIDKMVFLSDNQAQVLFTMRVAPVVRKAQERDEQASAQLLFQNNQLFVCQYLLRSGSQY